MGAGRARPSKFWVLKDSFMGLLIYLTGRKDKDCIVWDEANNRYTHEARQLPIVRQTAAEFTAANSILKAGEEGYETDTRKRKVGDGVTAWNSLAYDVSSSTGGSTVQTLRRNWFHRR